MHAQRASDPNQVPLCSDLINALRECHRVHYLSKFIGACNDARTELDKCLRKEKGIRREANKEKAGLKEQQENRAAMIQAVLAKKRAAANGNSTTPTNNH